VSLLEIKDLSIEFETRQGRICPVDRVSFNIEAGETLGIVGESGSGNSLTSLAIMGLLPPNSCYFPELSEVPASTRRLWSAQSLRAFPQQY